MYRNIVISFSLIVSTALNAQAIFLSEYAEGSSYHKYIEIFNGTGADLDLSTYSLSSCSNGCDEAQVLEIAAKIVPNQRNHQDFLPTG